MLIYIKKHLHKMKVRIRVLSIDRFLQKVGTPEIYDTPVFRYGKRAQKLVLQHCCKTS